MRTKDRTVEVKNATNRFEFVCQFCEGLARNGRVGTKIKSFSKCIS